MLIDFLHLYETLAELLLTEVIEYHRHGLFVLSDDHAFAELRMSHDIAICEFLHYLRLVRSLLSGCCKAVERLRRRIAVIAVRCAVAPSAEIILSGIWTFASQACPGPDLFIYGLIAVHALSVHLAEEPRFGLVVGPSV